MKLYKVSVDVAAWEEATGNILRQRSVTKWNTPEFSTFPQKYHSAVVRYGKEFVTCEVVELGDVDWQPYPSIGD
jgi:hypothetical protein